MTAADTFSQQDFRGGIRTTGEFALNRDWTYGWDGTMSAPTAPSRATMTSSTTIRASTISFAHLTGLRDRNYFDARVEYFEILADSTRRPTIRRRTARRSSCRSSTTTTSSTTRSLGGEVAVRSNLVNLTREDARSVPGQRRDASITASQATISGRPRSIEWQRKFDPVRSARSSTTFASARGDAFYAMDPRTMAASGPS